MTRVLVGVLSIAVSGFALYGWSLGAVFVPDFSLYTVGGFGLFPSPVGRALGALGPGPFAAASIISAGASVVLVALLARARGGVPAVAAIAFALSPAALYLGYAGIDPIALALLLGGLASSSTRVVSVAALAHFSLLPFAVVHAVRRATFPAIAATGFVLFCAAIALALTPYQAILWLWLDWSALPTAGVALAIGLGLSAPGLLLTRPCSWWWFALLVGVLESAAQLHAQARYFLPAAALAGVGSLRPWFARCCTASSLRMRSIRQAALRLKTAPTASYDGRGSYGLDRLPASARAVTAAVDVRSSGNPLVMSVNAEAALDTRPPVKPDASVPRRASTG